MRSPGHQDVDNEGDDDLSEGGADHDTDGEIEDVSAQQKSLEILENRSSGYSP